MTPLSVNKELWVKGRGYLHITPKINVYKRYDEITKKVLSEEFVARHSFSPLIHSVVKERKYKKLPNDPKKRAHSYKDDKNHGKINKTEKIRPLHYSTHIDALIFGYYADLISKHYENELAKYSGLSDCIIAYRKIAIDDEDEYSKGKSTIHFAHEAFEEIKKRGANDCIVLMFDIKSFFNELNHEKLKQAWCDLFSVTRLNKAHFNVFKAATDLRYILLDDLRLKSDSKKRKGFDERKLAYIRKTRGEEVFFESIEEFRNAIKNKEIKVFKRPFVKDKKMVGIPQGLPISAVLANLYLLQFDKVVLETVVKGYDAFYRRYSDDILIICKPEQAEEIEDFIMQCIQESFVKISQEKTEKYLFRNIQVGYNKNRLTSILLAVDRCVIGKPLTYLGFEFYGHKTLIKSSNLARFYRRLIYAVKKKAIRASKLRSDVGDKVIIFRGRLKKLYTEVDLSKEKQHKRKQLVKNVDGTYAYRSIKYKGDVKDKQKRRTNYISYVKRASHIMNEEAIENQIKKHETIFNQAIARFRKKFQDGSVN